MADTSKKHKWIPSGTPWGGYECRKRCARCGLTAFKTKLQTGFIVWRKRWEQYQVEKLPPCEPEKNDSAKTTLGSTRGGMARTSDPLTSHEAADVVAPRVTAIQTKVLEAFTTHGNMTAYDAEKLDEFSQYGHATIRKRISELARSGYLTERGVDRTRASPSRIYGIDKLPRGVE